MTGNTVRNAHTHTKSNSLSYYKRQRQRQGIPAILGVCVWRGLPLERRGTALCIFVVATAGQKVEGQKFTLCSTLSHLPRQSLMSMLELRS